MLPVVCSTCCKLGNIEQLHDRVHNFEPGLHPNVANESRGGYQWYSTSVDPRIIDIFPLKDEEWIVNMEKLWLDRGGVIQSMKGMQDVWDKQTQNVNEDIANNVKEAARTTSETIHRLTAIHHEAIETLRDIDGIEVGGFVETVRERVNLTDQPSGRSPAELFVRCTILVRGIAADMDNKSFEHSMKPHLLDHLCLQATILSEGPCGDAAVNQTARLGFVTLDQESSVAAVLAAFEAEADVSIEKLKDTALEIAQTFPRAFNKAREAAIAKAAELAAGTPAGAPADLTAKLREWQQVAPRTQRKHKSEDSVSTPNGFCSFLPCACSFSIRKLCGGMAYAFSRRDDEILKKMCEEYGPKVAIYFAFLNSYTTSMGLLALVGSTLFVLARILDRIVYLRWLGLVGLLAASVWGPLATVWWHRRVNYLLFEWQMKAELDTDPGGDLDEKLGRKESTGLNLRYNDEEATNAKLGRFLAFLVCPVLSLIVARYCNFGAWRALILSLILICCLKPQNWHVHPGLKKVMVIAVTFVLLLVGVVTVLAFNFLLIEYTQYLTTLPLCNTYFHQVFEMHNNFTAGGLFSTTSSYLPFGPDCFNDISKKLWTWRGFLIFLVGIIAGLLIDIVWDIVFRKLFAEPILNLANIKKQADYEYYRVCVYFPFMWSAFMSYFLLAAALVPFGPYIDPWLLRYISWLTTIKQEAVTSVTDFSKTVTEGNVVSTLVDGSLNDLGLGRNRSHVYGSCQGNMTLAGSAGGPQPSAACVFPLHYCDIGSGICNDFDGCTIHGSEMYGRAWCATRSQAEGGWHDGNWGYCDCSGERLTHNAEILNPARVDNLMAYWRYNHRSSIPLDTLMTGPLVVAIWLDFVFKNLIPFAEYHRRRFLALRRGQKIGWCARFLIMVTCCCGFHEGEALHECIGEEDNWDVARQQFAKRLKHKLVESVEPTLMASSSGTTAQLPPTASAQTKLIIVKSMSAYHQQDDNQARQQVGTKEEREHAKYVKYRDQSTCNTYRCSRCCAGSCCDPGSCCTIKCKWCRCKCCDEAEEELDMNRRAANYLLVESSMWHYDNFFEYAELVGQFSYVTMFTVVFPLGAVMALLRNLVEAQWDASRMWRDFKRPIPSRPSSTRPLGGWEKMIGTQTTISCIFTSAFFVRTACHLAITIASSLRSAISWSLAFYA